jgi:hypothetical protein
VAELVDARDLKQDPVASPIHSLHIGQKPQQFHFQDNKRKNPLSKGESGSLMVDVREEFCYSLII